MSAPEAEAVAPALVRLLAESLAATWLVREFEIEQSLTCRVVERDLCPGCGSSARGWALWVNFTDRCTDAWHAQTCEAG